MITKCSFQPALRPSSAEEEESSFFLTYFLLLALEMDYLRRSASVFRLQKNLKHHHHKQNNQFETDFKEGN
jgi:hypothetical protein